MSHAKCEAAALSYLRTNDGATERPRMVAEAVGCTVAQAVVTLEALERAGLVERVGRASGGNFSSLWRAL